MNVLQAAVLGLVQGLCEFLPVSSSGHLVLFQNMMGVTGDVLFFDTMLHVGTLAALIVVYARTIWDALRHPTSKLSRYVLAGTVPLVVVALLGKSFIEESFEGALLGYGFLFTAVLLTFAERMPNRYKKLNEMRLRDPVVMGFMQGIAVLPGISRSGSTIAGGLIMGVERETAANISFLLSGPAICGALVLQLYDVAKANAFSHVQWAPVIVGTLVAAVTGVFAIQFMLHFIKRHKLYGFAIYVAVLGFLVLMDQHVTHFVF